MKIYNEAHLTILTDVKKVYFNQLYNFIKNITYEVFQDIFKNSMKESNKRKIDIFRKQLSLIPKWDTEKINNILFKLYAKTNENKITKLIRALIITSTKLLASVKMHKKKITSVTLNIPNNQKFLHFLLIQCAREFYKNAILFDYNIKGNEKRINLRESFNIISECLNNSIEEFLPIDEIINQNLLENSDDEEIETDDEEIETDDEEIETDDEEVGSEVETDDEVETTIENKPVEVNNIQPPPPQPTPPQPTPPQPTQPQPTQPQPTPPQPTPPQPTKPILPVKVSSDVPIHEVDNQSTIVNKEDYEIVGNDIKNINLSVNPLEGDKQGNIIDSPTSDNTKVVNISENTLTKKIKLINKKKKKKSFINDYVNNIENSVKHKKSGENNYKIDEKEDGFLLFSDAESD